MQRNTADKMQLSNSTASLPALASTDANQHCSASSSAATLALSSANQRVASASSSVAADESRKIKLTRYQTLAGGEDISTRQQPNGAAAAAASEDKTSTTANKPDHILSNKLWAIASYQQQQQQQQHHLQPPAAGAEGLERANSLPNYQPCKSGHNQEPFQIVWTRLAFEVRLSAYGKILNKTYSCLRTICGFGSSPGAGATPAAAATQKSLEAGVLPPPPPPTQKSNNNNRPGTNENSKRTIFENLNGYINSGELTAILGPSGSGKTSLLNAICGRTENYRGQMRLVGAGKQRRMRLSIIPQKDYLIENLTVRENLLYSSRILNPDGEHDHEAGVARVVEMLNLSACYHSQAANISGGEYKRVSIAQELLRQPDILVLDEPTSGLDSLNCKKLIKSLVQLIEVSRRGNGLRPIAIVMTIHQPDVEVFHMFDHIYCMARGGRVIFDGKPRDALAHIQEHANIPASKSIGAIGSSGGHNNSNTGSNNNDQTAAPQAAAINPANLLIEIASEDLYGQEPIERLARVQRKRYEQMLDPVTGAISPDARQKRQADSAGALSQLHANLLATAAAAAAEAEGSAPHKTKRDNEQQVAGGSATDSGDGSTSTLASSQCSSRSSSTSAGSAASQSVTIASRRRLVRDKRLTVKNDHSGRFWYYTRVLAQRSFKSTLRDPLMTLITMLFHLCIPFVMWTVYPRRIGTVHGCPVIQHELDIVSMASERTADRLEDLHEQVIGTLECSTMFFLTTYSFSMCSLTVSALAFPLNMHVLLKEVRNGWYNLPAYVLAKTVANFPFEVLFPVASLIMIYALLDMPNSPYEWRMWAMCLVMAMVSMISHTQGLIFGALCMDSVQTAIFMASASTLPQALLSGFTARIRFMPLLLQRLSWLSQYRYSSDLINMIRFGFGICPCGPSTDEYLRTRAPEFKDMPGNLKPVFIYYLMSNTAGVADPTAAGDNSTTLSPMNTTTLATTTTTTEQWIPPPPPPPTIPGVDSGVMLSPEERFAFLKRMDAGEVDLFANMAEMISRAFSFGRKLEGCPSVRSQLLATGGTPPDQFLPFMFAGMLGLLLAYKLILFFTVKCKIGNRL